jgi:hypothetical protein
MVSRGLWCVLIWTLFIVFPLSAWNALFLQTGARLISDLDFLGRLLVSNRSTPFAAGLTQKLVSLLKSSTLISTHNIFFMSVNMYFVIRGKINGSEESLSSIAGAERNRLTKQLSFRPGQRGRAVLCGSLGSGIIRAALTSSQPGALERGRNTEIDGRGMPHR